MTSGYYCAIFPFCGGGEKKKRKKKKDYKKTKAFYDWATTGIPVKTAQNSILRLPNFLLENLSNLASAIQISLRPHKQNSAIFHRNVTFGYTVAQ